MNYREERAEEESAAVVTKNHLALSKNRVFGQGKEVSFLLFSGKLRACFLASFEEMVRCCLVAVRSHQQTSLPVSRLSSESRMPCCVHRWHGGERVKRRLLGRWLRGLAHRASRRVPALLELVQWKDKHAWFIHS